MSKLTAAQNCFLENATLIAALQLIFQRLEESESLVYSLSELAETTSGGLIRCYLPFLIKHSKGNCESKMRCINWDGIKKFSKNPSCL